MSYRIAFGINKKGKRIRIECIFGILSYCQAEYESDKLVSLEIPYGITTVYCYNNLITELKIPTSVYHIQLDKTVKGLDKYIDKKEKEFKIILH